MAVVAAFAWTAAAALFWGAVVLLVWPLARIARAGAQWRQK